MRSAKVGLAALAALLAVGIGAPVAGAVPTCGYWSNPAPTVEIASAQDLNALAYCVANNAVKPDLNVSVAESFTADVPVTPIGTLSNPFVGTFDGNDQSITGLTVSGGGSDQQGLFGVVGDSSTGGLIRDLRLVAPAIAGKDEVGALVGRLAAGTITGVSLERASVSGDYFVGTLVGFITSVRAVTISGVASDGNAVGTGTNVGGVVGRAHFQGAAILLDGVTSSGSATGFSSVGGVIGQATYGAAGATIILRDVASRASVVRTANVTGYGGLIGYVNDNPTLGTIAITLERTYAAGAVSTLAGGSGGVIGAVWVPARVAVTGTAFWDPAATGQADPITSAQSAVLAGVATSKTTAELTNQATYTGWSIAALGATGGPPSVWTTCSGFFGGYPFLRDAYVAGSCVTPTAPTNVTATPGNGIYRVAFTAPAAGDAPITEYQYSLDGTTWATAGQSGPLPLDGDNDTTYTVRIRAVSAAGSGAASAPVTVTPGPCVGANGRQLAGRGTAAAPYAVADAEDLRAVGTGTCGLWDAYRQTASITMPPATTANGVTSNFTPIGSAMDPFWGTYDGQGFAIDGLVFDDPTANDVGLFGSVADVGQDPAVVRNVRVTAVRIVGSMHVGAIVGLLDARNHSVQVEDVSSTGSVTGSTRVGGLIGRVLSLPSVAFGTPMAAVSGLTSTAAVTAASSAGGAIGVIDVSGTAGASVSDVATSGVVTATGSGAGFGGIVGRVIVSNAGLSAAEAASRIGGAIGSIAITGTTRAVRIERAAATSHYLGATSEAGGLIGYVSRGGTDPVDYQVGRVELKDSYATVPLVPAVAPATAFGGLIGRLANLAAASGGLLDLERVYAAGWVPSGGNAIVGDYGFSSSSGTLPMWDREATGQTSSGVAGMIDYSGGSTTAQMQDFATFTSAGWPIVLGWREPTAERVWGICGTGNGYPYLLSHADHAPCDFPHPPVDVVATPGDGSAVLTFSPGRAGDFPTTGYEYTLDGGQTVGNGGSGSPLTITGLRNGETVFVSLRAVTEAGPGWWGQGVYVTPVAAPSSPATPANLTRSPLRLQTPTALAGGRVQVAMEVSGPGTLAMTATPTARAGRAACATTRKVKAAGTYRLTCRLNRATRVRLAKAGLRLQVAVVFRPTKGAATTQLTTVTVPRRR